MVYRLFKLCDKERHSMRDDGLEFACNHMVFAIDHYKFCVLGVCFDEFLAE